MASCSTCVHYHVAPEAHPCATCFPSGARVHFVPFLRDDWVDPAPAERWAASLMADLPSDARATVITREEYQRMLILAFLRGWCELREELKARGLP